MSLVSSSRRETMPRTMAESSTIITLIGAGRALGAGRLILKTPSGDARYS
jgi:hypothetical protein